MATFLCDFSLEYVYDATTKKRKARSRKKNKICGLMRDDYDHVLLWFGTNVKSKVRDKFKLENNIQNIFYSHVNEGKLTIELREPHVLIYIDPSSEAMRVDTDEGKTADPTGHVSFLRSLARKLSRLKARGQRAARDLALTFSDDEDELELAKRRPIDAKDTVALALAKKYADEEAKDDGAQTAADK